MGVGDWGFPLSALAKDLFCGIPVAYDTHTSQCYNNESVAVQSDLDLGQKMKAFRDVLTQSVRSHGNVYTVPPGRSINLRG